MICHFDREEHWKLYSVNVLCCVIVYFFQDEDPDLSSQSVANTNKSDGWEEVDSVSTKPSENRKR